MLREHKYLWKEVVKIQIPKKLENGILSEDLKCTFRIYKDDDKMVCITIGDKDVWQTGVRGRNIKQAIDRFHRIMSMAVAQCEGV